MPLDDRDYIRQKDGKHPSACTCITCNNRRKQERQLREQRQGAVVKGFPERVFKPNTPNAVTQQVAKKPPIWKRAIAKLRSYFTSHKKN
jgi:hypothetical protein